MASRDIPPLASSFWPIFFRSQLLFRAQFPPKDTNLSGQCAIITGGNQGLGFEAARQLLSFGLSQLILAVRSEVKGKAAASKLQAEYPKATVKVWMLDMCSYESVQALVKRVESELPRLDIAILNAGRSKGDFELVSSTGHEETIQVNYLSTMLLATSLLPILKNKSPHGTPGRLSIVGSGSTFMSEFSNSQQSPLLKSFDSIESGPGVGMQTYSTSKVLGQMFLWKLVDYVSADDVIVNVVDPGMTRGTGLGRDVPWIVRALASPVLFALSRSVRNGASTYLDATIVKGKESHGCFLMDWEIRPFPSLLYTENGKVTIERLWQETMEEFSFAGISGLLESLKES